MTQRNILRYGYATEATPWRAWVWAPSGLSGVDLRQAAAAGVADVPQCDVFALNLRDKRLHH